jgi:hypothetical protein
MKRCLDCYTLPPLMDVLKAMIMDSHEKITYSYALSIMVISCLVVDAGNPQIIIVYAFQWT